MTATERPDAAAVHSRMAELVSKFVARTGGDVAQMRAALAQLEAGDGSGLAQIQQLAHRACGTGGTLGLLALADAAGGLERLTEACPANAVPADATRAQISAAIDRVAAELALL